MLDFSWSNILHSNVINFAIMIALFAFIISKLKVAQKIEDFRTSVKKSVDDSDLIKDMAKKEFEKVADSLAHVDDELSSIVKRANETAKSFETKTREDLSKTVDTIKLSVKKQIQSEENQVKTALMNNISESSIEAAQKQIKSALVTDKTLHRKYIADFINSIEGLEV